MSIEFTDNIPVMTGVSETTTSSAYDLSKRQQATAVYTCKGRTSGNGVFTVDISNDNSNWVTSIACQDATSTDPVTWITSKTLNSDTSAAVKLPMGYRFYRFVCTVTTDGTYSVVVEAGG